MESILIIQNGNKLDESLISPLLPLYKIYEAKNIAEAIDFIQDVFIDVFIIVTRDYVDLGIKQFLIELHSDRSLLTPVILISEINDEKLQAQAFTNKIFSLISKPVVEINFLEEIKKSIMLSSLVDERTITLIGKRGTGVEKTYKVRNIYLIERHKHRHIIVHSWDEYQRQHMQEEYFFSFPLSSFPKKFNLEKHLKQCHQSWLVNVNKITKIDEQDMEVHLENKQRAPVGATYLKQIKGGKS